MDKYRSEKMSHYFTLWLDPGAPGSYEFTEVEHVAWLDPAPASRLSQRLCRRPRQCSA